jgi:hypothetical protein
MEIHDAVALAFHVHPAGAVTDALPLDASDAKVAVAGATVYEHTGLGSIGDTPSPQLVVVM